MKLEKSKTRIKPLSGLQPLSRQHMIGVARELIREQGFEGFSMRSFARRLGVSATAIYVYFEDKFDLLTAVADSEYESRAQQYTALRHNCPLDNLRGMAHIYIRSAVDSPELFRLSREFSPISFGADPDERRRVGHHAFQVGEDYVREAIRQNLLHGNPRELAINIWAAINGVANFALNRNAFIVGREIETVNGLLDALFKGLGPPHSVDAPKTAPKSKPRRRPK